MINILTVCIIKDINQLKKIGNDGKLGSPLVSNRFEDGKINTEIYDNIKELTIERIYYGNEFCEFLIPTLNQVKSVIYEAEKRNLKFSLLTPVVSDFGITKLLNIFDYLDENYHEIEVIFNDIGVLNLIKTKYKNIIPVAGRSIDKMLREPRILEGEYEQYFNEEGLSYIQKPNVTSKYYQEFLFDMGVNQVELDFVPQGFSDININSAINISVYFPFYYVTTGRHCIMRMHSRNDEEKFVIDNTCDCLCKKYNVVLNKYGDGIKKYISNRGLRLLRKGNTIYGVNSNFDKLVKNSFYNRLVIQLEL